MRFPEFAMGVLALALLLPSCRCAAPTATTEDPPGDSQPTPLKGGGLISDEPELEAPRSVATHVSEWAGLGLSEDQIRAKISGGMEDEHFTATALTEAEAEALEKAGISHGLIAWLQGLDLPAADANP